MAAHVPTGMDRREFLAAGVAALPLAGCVRLRPVVAAREPLALATADTEAHVAAVSLRGRRVVRRVRTIEGPRSIQSGPGGVAIVGHSAAGAVTLLEGRPPRVRRVLRGFSEPRYTAFAPGGRFAFVTDSGTGEVAVVDVLRGRVVRRVEVGALARHVGIDPRGRRLWISLGSSAAAIAVVDVSEPRRPRLLRTIDPPFLVHDVAFSPDGRRVWVTAGREPKLAVYAAHGRSPIRQLAADLAPQHVTFGPGRAYVASGEGRSVHVHSLRDGRRLRAARVPIGSYNVQRGGGMILTPSLNTGALTVLDGRGRVRASTRVASAAHDACVVS
jgi:DNA-binding beta-propeller fold protein YncE